MLKISWKLIQSAPGSLSGLVSVMELKHSVLSLGWLFPLPDFLKKGSLSN